MVIFYGRGCFFVRCCRKNLQCRSARFFRSRWTEVVFRPTPACFHLLGMENINQTLQKNMIHRVTQIEHFLLDIIHILFRDLIQNTITDIGHFKAATDIILPTLRNFFYRRWPIIIFLYGRGCFFVRCWRKNLQRMSARFFRSSSTDVVFRPTPACFHLPGMENTNQPLQKKNMIARYWSKKMVADVCKESLAIEVYKKITGWRRSNISY